MTRELNPTLFGDGFIRPLGQNPVKANIEPTNQEPIAPALMPQPQVETERRGTVKAVDDSLKALNARIDELSARNDQYLRAQQNRVDLLAQKIDQVAKIQAQIVKDLNIKYSGLAGKLRERNLSENKVENMIERHNQIVQNFQNRLSQLQRVLNEKEVQHLTMASALEETRRDLARMKRL